MPSKLHLPVIDADCLFASDAESDETRAARLSSSARLFSAFETSGIAYLRFNASSRGDSEHTALDQHVQPAFSSARSFFRRPLAEKQSATTKGLPPGVTRGYIETAAESGAQSVEWKEAFSWSYDWDSRTSSRPQSALEAENIWPRIGLSDSTDMVMKSTFDTLYSFMVKVMLAVADALRTAWRDDAGPVPDLDSFCRQGESISLLRAFHYHGTEFAEKDMTGSSQHTDWGFATLIAQENGSASALQVCVDGDWHDVPAMADTLVVNCSDFLSLLTGGRLQSPLHRVILTARERFSFVFFQYPGFDTPVPDVAVCGSRGRSSSRLKSLSLLQDQSVRSEESATRVREISFGEFIARKWQQVSR